VNPKTLKVPVPKTSIRENKTTTNSASAEVEWEEVNSHDDTTKDVVDVANCLVITKTATAKIREREHDDAWAERRIKQIRTVVRALVKDNNGEYGFLLKDDADEVERLATLCANKASKSRVRDFGNVALWVVVLTREVLFRKRLQNLSIHGNVDKETAKSHHPVVESQVSANFLSQEYLEDYVYENVYRYRHGDYSRKTAKIEKLNRLLVDVNDTGLCKSALAGAAPDVTRGISRGSLKRAQQRAVTTHPIFGK
jgi:hypothetical protein